WPTTTHHPKPLTLPHYPFQRRRHWINTNTTNSTGTTTLGLDPAEHPLLGAATTLADGEGVLLTGRLSLDSHSWLTDHAVSGTVLVPGTALLELALHAGRKAGYDRLADLTLESPLILPARGGVRLQLMVGRADDAGRIPLTIHSRPDAEAADSPWTRHATGLLEADAGHAPAPVAQEAWPPVGAEPVPVDSLYEQLAATGYEYGPLFQGVQALWRDGDRLLAEVALPEEVYDTAAVFALHPALSDAALHPVVSGLLPADGPADGEQILLPFSWSGVTLGAIGATTLRVRLTRLGEGVFSLVATDPSGLPVLSVDSLTFRPLPVARLVESGHPRTDSLYRIDWAAITAAHASSRLAVVGDDPTGLTASLAAERYPDLAALREAVDAGSPVPETVVTCWASSLKGPDPVDVAVRAGAAARRALALLQDWLADDRFGRARLVLVTRRAVPDVPHEGSEAATDLVHSPVWGLARSAQTEHPERIVLLDTDDDEESRAALAAALALTGGEPQLRVRHGACSVPRLVRVPRDAMDTALASPIVADPESTVLVTGATGALGRMVARHLSDRHGVRHLLLVGRRGLAADGLAELADELGDRGVQVTVAACDVADREQLTALLDTVPAAHPLAAVVHAAGVLDDAPVDSLTDAQLERVLRPKVDAAVNLHELTRFMGLSAFVLFSSVAGVLGNPGQANYAAANAFLDALAQHRGDLGLPVVSLAWGLWAETSGMTGHLSETDLRRLSRAGLTPLSTAEGLRLLDEALGLPAATLVPARIDVAALAGRAASGSVPPLLRGLVRTPARRAVRGADGPADGLARRLARVPAAEQEEVLLELVRTHVASALGYGSGQTVDRSRAFKDLGFDSLTSVELRNRLNEATGLQLPATVLFDHPTPDSLVRRLRTEFAVDPAAPEPGAGAAPSAAADEPIAIVGMSCRFPGGAHSPEDLWQLVSSGTDAVGPLPTGRGWDLDTLYHPDPEHPGTFYATAGGLLEDDVATGFDAEFFGISPREALAMDPQQRLLLETAWEAVERAGIDPRSLRGTRTGVFVGAMASDYATVAPQEGQEVEGYLLTGTSGSVLSGRLAYSFGLEGSAITIDTACSSSLVALHTAAQSLRRAECSMALVAGVTVMATPRTFVEFSRQRGLAPDGRCKSFAEAADGTGWAEGAGVLLVERLSEARRLGHPVLAVLRGSAVNQDGASNGLTAPNGPAQQRVIQDALRDARISAAEVDAVEAHGTGTELGDPIEAQAIVATYGRQRDEQQPLWLGSLKSNIGHAQAAAGIGGVIKMVMAMRHGILPRTLHVDRPSTHVDWSSGTVRLLTEQREWPETGRPRRTGVSSFGISGTNAHVVLEYDPQSEADTSDAPEQEAPAVSTAAVPWVLSARTADGLRAQAERMRSFVERRPLLDPAAVARALVSARALFEHRAVITGTGREDLLDGLTALAQGEPRPGTSGGVAPASARVAFLFTGQGSQSVGMARELYEQYEVFARALDEVCAALHPALPVPLAELLLADPTPALDSRLNRTGFAQPALFAFQVALSRLLESWGLRPDAVAGHSVGELAAAHVAGALSLADAAALVTARAAAMEELPSRGAMVALQMSEAEVMPLIEGRTDAVSLAAVNGPSSVVLAGDEDEVLAVAALAREKGRKTHRLRVSHAFHSPHMDPVLDALRSAAAELEHVPARIPFVSGLTGRRLGAVESGDGEPGVLGPEYWARHAREAVRFQDCVHELADLGTTLFVEVGPDGILTAMAQEALADRPVEAGFVATQRTGRPQARTLVDAVGQAHALGAEVSWNGLLDAPVTSRIASELPTYAFQHRRYWLSSTGAGVEAAGLVRADHPLLGAAVPLAGSAGTVFTGRLSQRTHPWLADHTVLGAIVVPGTALLELALYAGAETGCGQVAELVLEEPMVLPDSGALQVQLVVGDPEGGSPDRPVRVYARPEAGESADQPGWTRHASGTLRPEGASVADAGLEVWPPSDAQAVPTDGLYERLADAGFSYGPVFRGLRAAWRRDAEIFAEIVPTEPWAADEHFGIQPAALDAALNALKLDVLDGRDDDRLPFAFSGVTLHTAGSGILRVRLAPRGTDGYLLQAANQAGRPVLSIDGVTLRRLPAGALERTRGGSRPLYRLGWVPVPGAPLSDHDASRWAVVGAHSTELLPDADAYSDLAALLADLDDGARLPEAVVLTALASPSAAGPDPAGVERAVLDTLRTVQDWLAADRLTGIRLIVATRGAVGVRDADTAPDLAGAAVWGLLRAAQAEHPGRFLLIDLDGAGSAEAGPLLLPTDDEPQLAVRAGVLYAPRLTKAIVTPREGADGDVFGAEGTVLLSGATGALGGLLARHLVSEHGVRRLLLVSRRGPAAGGAAQLLSDLAELGADAELVACDLSDRRAVDDLLAAVPAEHPLTTIVHAAGVLDDGVIQSLTERQVTAVLRAKVDAAVHLHDATKDRGLRAFVLFSSASGTLGTPGQGNYAAANAFLDAFARYRVAQGLPATSLAWGLWARDDGMAGSLGGVGLRRLARAGVAALSDREALELFDAACAGAEPVLLPVRLDLPALRALGGGTPAVMLNLVPRPAQREDRADGPVEMPLTDRLAALSKEESESALLDLVRSQAAAVLGFADLKAVGAERGFLDLGFDSLTAIEFRNRLARLTGLPLPPTVLFDFPEPVLLAKHLQELLAEQTRGARGTDASAASFDALDLDRLEDWILDRLQGGPGEGNVARRLRDMLARASAADRTHTSGADPADRLDESTDDEIFDLIDNDLGVS
ncbi:SDR family NAD(P)-dependent oxidoreductase, partial [Streptomyces lavendulae]|uniref:SDR family NAD(P)-dependent oxidoreductase n=1 Tax=Streptomyces lavendulae TaxID=1914 RepID=UPI00340A5F33